MLQHEVMVVDEWHVSGPQELVTVSVCIQIAINKMHLCLLSVAYAYPYHNPTTTMGHSIHVIVISKPLAHTTPHMLSAICPVQWKLGFIREEKMSICSLKPVTATNFRQFKTLVRTTSTQMSFPETVSNSLYRNSLVVQTSCCISCPGGCSQNNLAGEEAGWGGPGLVWSHMVCGCEAGWMYCQNLGNDIGDLWQWNEHSVHRQQLWWTFLQSACQLHTPSKLVTSVALCYVIKLHILEWPFIVTSPRHTCVLIIPFNQLPDMPHLLGGWIILAKEKCTLTQI